MINQEFSGRSPPALGDSPKATGGSSEGAAAFERFSTSNRFGSLDALRALSIIAVLWTHSGGPNPLPLLSQGQMGVHLFFAISGFLITSLLLREFRKYGEISIRNFVIRRALRIFPLYYGVLFAYIAIVHFVEGDTEDAREFFSNLPYFLTYTTNLFVSAPTGERVIFFFSWSLATEEQFYLLFPTLLLLLGRRWTPVFLLVLAAIVFSNHMGWLVDVISLESMSYKILFEIAPCIVLGSIAAFTSNTPRGYQMLYSVLGHRYASAVCLALPLIILSLPESSMLQTYLAYLAFVALVLSCSLREDHCLASIMRWQPLVRLGAISYGVYLLHMLCFNVADRLWFGAPEDHWIGRLTIGFVLVVIAAEISFRTFESWFLNLKVRFERK